jgi:hypothetical protein
LDWTVVLLFDMGFVWRIFSVDILIIEIWAAGKKFCLFVWFPLKWRGREKAVFTSL